MTERDIRLVEWAHSWLAMIWDDGIWRIVARFGNGWRAMEYVTTEFEADEITVQWANGEEVVVGRNEA